MWDTHGKATRWVRQISVKRRIFSISGKDEQKNHRCFLRRRQSFADAAPLVLGSTTNLSWPLFFIFYFPPHKTSSSFFAFPPPRPNPGPTNPTSQSFSLFYDLGHRQGGPFAKKVFPLEGPPPCPLPPFPPRPPPPYPITNAAPLFGPQLFLRLRSRVFFTRPRMFRLPCK